MTFYFKHVIHQELVVQCEFTVVDQTLLRRVHVRKVGSFSIVDEITSIISFMTVIVTSGYFTKVIGTFSCRLLHHCCNAFSNLARVG